MGVNKEKRNREEEQTSKTHPQFRSQAATRLREVGEVTARSQPSKAELMIGVKS